MGRVHARKPSMRYALRFQRSNRLESGPRSILAASVVVAVLVAEKQWRVAGRGEHRMFQLLAKARHWSVPVVRTKLSRAPHLHTMAPWSRPRAQKVSGRRFCTQVSIRGGSQGQVLESCTHLFRYMQKKGKMPRTLQA